MSKRLKQNAKRGCVLGFGFAIIITISLSQMNYNEIGLSVLSLVKNISGKAVDVSSLAKEETALINHDLWDQVLKQYVSQDGNVNYSSLLKDQEQFNQYLSLLSQNPPGHNWSQQDQLVYWINAYNAFTVKLILNHYPLKSIKDISKGLPMINSPWDIKFFTIGDVPFDLNTIEHEILRKLDEPRIHFAINCASFSCPVLRKEAYIAEHLEQQLQEQTHLFINNPSKNTITSTEQTISKIFDWFSSDFGSANGVKALLNKHHKSFDEKKNISYMDYNWSLNEAE